MLDELARLTRQRLPARQRRVVAQGSLIQAAVLLPLLDRGEAHVVFVKRTDRVGTHKGQISFPGGTVDPGDASAEAAALRECEEDTRKICTTYQKRRDVLVSGLKRAGWPVEKPRGSMFLWAPLPERHRAAGSLEFAKLLLEKALVAVSPGVGFGPLGEGHVRFALVENEQRIRQATRAIGQFLKNG